MWTERTAFTKKYALLDQCWCILGEEREAFEKLAFCDVDRVFTIIELDHRGVRVTYCGIVVDLQRFLHWI